MEDALFVAKANKIWEGKIYVFRRDGVLGFIIGRYVLEYSEALPF